MLPQNFPYLDLIEVLTHQLLRPGHLDRYLAQTGALELCRDRGFLLGPASGIGLQAVNHVRDSIDTPDCRYREVAKPVVENLADINAVATERGQARQRVGSRAAGDLMQG